MTNQKKAVVCLIVSLACVCLLILLNVSILTREAPEMGDSPFVGLGIYMYGFVTYLEYFFGTVLCTVTGALCALFACFKTQKLAIRVTGVIAAVVHAGCLVGFLVVYRDLVWFLLQMMFSVG